MSANQKMNLTYKCHRFLKHLKNQKFGFGLLIWRVASRDSLDNLFTSLALDGGSDHKHVRKKLFV